MHPSTAGPSAPSDSAAAGSSRSAQIIGLDVIRFIAAVMVMFVHLGWVAYLNRPATVLQRLAPVFAPGWIGVEIFFVLSGFVIAFSASKATPRSFVRSRIVRLYPAAWICSTITLVVVVVIGRIPLRSSLLPWLHSFLLLPRGEWIDSVYWTLGLEMVFYAVILLHLLVGRYRILGMTFSLLGAVSSAFWVQVLLHRSQLAAAGYEVLSLHPYSALTLLQHGCFFSIGVLLWLVLLDRPTPLRVAALACTVPGALIEIWAHAAVIRTAFHRDGFAYSWWQPLCIWTTAVGFIILSVRYNASITSRCSDRVRNQIRTLGLISYPLYLVHQHMGYVLLYRLNAFMPAPAAVTLMTAFSLVCAWVIGTRLEVPLQRRLATALGGAVRPREMPASSTP